MKEASLFFLLVFGLSAYADSHSDQLKIELQDALKKRDETQAFIEGVLDPSKTRCPGDPPKVELKSPPNSAALPQKNSKTVSALAVPIRRAQTVAPGVCCYSPEDSLKDTQEGIFMMLTDQLSNPAFINQIQLPKGTRLNLMGRVQSCLQGFPPTVDIALNETFFDGENGWPRRNGEAPAAQASQSGCPSGKYRIRCDSQNFMLRYNGKHGAGYWDLLLASVAGIPPQNPSDRGLRRPVVDWSVEDARMNARGAGFAQGLSMGVIDRNTVMPGALFNSACGDPEQQIKMISEISDIKGTWEAAGSAATQFAAAIATAPLLGAATLGLGVVEKAVMDRVVSAALQGAISATSYCSKNGGFSGGPGSEECFKKGMEAAILSLAFSLPGMPKGVKANVAAQEALEAAARSGMSSALAQSAQVASQITTQQQANAFILAIENLPWSSAIKGEVLRRLKALPMDQIGRYTGNIVTEILLPAAMSCGLSAGCDQQALIAAFKSQLTSSLLHGGARQGLKIVAAKTRQIFSRPSQPEETPHVASQRNIPVAEEPGTVISPKSAWSAPGMRPQESQFQASLPKDSMLSKLWKTPSATPTGQKIQEALQWIRLRYQATRDKFSMQKDLNRLQTAAGGCRP